MKQHIPDDNFPSSHEEQPLQRPLLRSEATRKLDRETIPTAHVTSSKRGGTRQRSAECLLASRLRYCRRWLQRGESISGAFMALQELRSYWTCCISSPSQTTANVISITRAAYNFFGILTCLCIMRSDRGSFPLLVAT
jgi:hypothetical protein